MKFIVDEMPFWESDCPFYTPDYPFGRCALDNTICDYMCNHTAGYREPEDCKFLITIDKGELQ